MLKLYWKIFLAFWLTGLILGGGALLVSQQLQQNSSLEISSLSPAELVNRTEFIIRRIPADAQDWQTRLAENDIALYLKSSPSYSLSQAKQPQHIASIMAYLNTQPEYEKSTFARAQAGRKLTSINGNTVYFVLDMPSINIFQLKQLAKHLTVQLGLAFILSAIACYIMAKYLTRNLKKISAASHALAQGDLSARIELHKTRVADELTLLGQDFNHMAAKLETSMNNQRRLVRDISHELRSPLARLQLALALARQKQEIPELGRIEQEANRLNDMIGQLLFMPKDQVDLDATIDLKELLESIIEDCQIEADAKQVQINFTCSHHEALLSANANLLHSALENILRNAIRYTATNTGILIKLIPAKESLKQTDTNNTSSASHLLTFEDHGAGIPAEDLPYIFEPFYRVDQARNRNTGGYGIGLAIVKHAVNTHNGSIEAHNTGSGLMVKLTLPAFFLDI